MATMTAHSAEIPNKLSAALEMLRQGLLDEAHRVLTRLMRAASQDVNVIFNLGLTRKRLGYDVSADALLQQAFERGYEPPVAELLDLPERPGTFRWTPAGTELSLLLHRRPRRQNYTLLEILPHTVPEPAALSTLSSPSDAALSPAAPQEAAPERETPKPE